LSQKREYGLDYALSGKDGVHPDWAGHVVMAYAFLKAMGLDGGIGTFTVDLAADRALVSDGHTLDSFTNHTLTITSHRYPFCATGATNSDDSIRSGHVPRAVQCRSEPAHARGQRRHRKELRRDVGR